MNINLDEILKPMLAILSNAASVLSKKERETMALYLSGLKERFLYYVNQSVAGTITFDTLTFLVKGEPLIIKTQVISLGLILGENVQELIDSTIGKLAQVTDELVVPILSNNKLDITLNGRTESIDTSNSFVAKDTGAQTPPTIEQKKIKYGVFFAGDLSTDQIIKVAKAMGVSVVRMGAVTTGYNKNKSKGYLAVKAAGFDIELTVSYLPITQDNGQRAAQPYATTSGDLQQYSTDLYNLLSDVMPAKVIFENEVMTDMFHSGDAPQYIGQSKVGVGVAKKLGIPCANSGDTKPGIVGAAYLYYKAIGRDEDAKYLYNNGMDSRSQKAVKKSWFYDKTLYAKFDEADYLMANYKYAGFDQVNIHLYEPLIPFARGNDTTSGCLGLIAEYAQMTSGLPVITNETGILQSNIKLLTNLMQDWIDADVKEITFFSSVSANGQTENLYSFDIRGNVVLNELGLAFASFVARN